MLRTSCILLRLNDTLTLLSLPVRLRIGIGRAHVLARLPLPPPLRLDSMEDLRMAPRSWRIATIVVGQVALVRIAKVQFHTYIRLFTAQTICHIQVPVMTITKIRSLLSPSSVHVVNIQTRIRTHRLCLVRSDSQSRNRRILYATQAPNPDSKTMNTTQRYPPRRCLFAETANKELTTIGPAAAASDWKSSASPFVVPSDAVPGV